MGKVERITLEPVKKAPEKMKAKLRVAAYCRVSTEMEDQKTSFEQQVKTYTQQIRANQEWEFAGVFADFGVTGTSAEKRTEFQRMVKACEEGKIDLILTKSISRFARNTLECLTYVRHLNNLGVHIIFESNNIDTRAAFSEMLLTVMAAFAQEESRSISENTVWGIRKRFEEGIARWCRIYGYEKTAAGEYQIVPAQAAVVQKVFALYEHGMTIKDIRGHLEELSIPSPNGTAKWSQSAVQTMLMNEKYIGDILLQKFCTENHITHKAVRNDQTEVPSYYIENHHTPIITRKQFDRVQKIRSMRRMHTRTADEYMGNCDQYPLGDKAVCPYCGSVLYQRSIPVQAGPSFTAWCCERGTDACHNFIIRSKMVEDALLGAYNDLEMKDVIALKGAAARQMQEMKKAYPTFDRVDYWWVDDLIDHIAFGAHSITQRELARKIALGEDAKDDRIMQIYWRCGLVSTVMSGIKRDKDHPRYVAELYNRYLERKAKKEETA